LRGKSPPVQPTTFVNFNQHFFLFFLQLLGGSRISIDELKEFAARQQQEIITKERELKTKQIQLLEMKRKSQKRSQNPYLQQLTAKADEQGEKLTALRKVQDQVDSYKLSNSALGMSEKILQR